LRDALQPDPILQSHLREAPWTSVATARLPGTGPVTPGDWLRVDEAYAPQIALRERLIAARHDQVHALMPQALKPAQELLSLVLAEVAARPDFQVNETSVIRPDGKTVQLNFDKPLLTLGVLVQQDFCILQRMGDEHVLTGAILCFPASWTLAEKIARPLTTIHDSVPEYGNELARRVQRLFDAVRPERPLWRVNLLLYHDATLHQPRLETDRRVKSPGQARFVRSERQCISRLPESDTIVFAIHTVVVRRSVLTREQLEGLSHYRSETT